ncbi:hypothetical protein [Leptospira sp. GIMC2001]|uniref:hypothetical protein n=1 Tax=Leptospira sp. GIMC2001 TaxID=1513297 RepID=UPI00234ABAB2|nr:hypothetical protein [Leptospira sp. GIMC2001]WCL48550.1 hypothetical protein O4O04_14745 [Leptospira sp. GIMC2001]
MKIIRILIIPIFLFGNCIQFDDGALDPNSALSQLRLLLGLVRSNSSLQTTIEMKLKKGDSSTYGGNLLEYGKQGVQASSQTNRSTQETRAIANASTTTIRSDGFVRVVLRELGVFEFIIKSPTGVQIASFELNITRGLDNNSLALLIPSNVSGDIVVEIISIIQSQLTDSQTLISIEIAGSIDSKIFGIGVTQLNSDGASSRKASILVGVDGKSFDAIPIPNDNFTESISADSPTTIFYFPSNPIKFGTKYFFLVRRFNFSTNELKTFAIQTDGFTINSEDVYEVSSRNSSYPRIDNTRIFNLSDFLVYGEQDNSSLIQMRYDTNLLKPGSSNGDLYPDLIYVNPGFVSTSHYFEHKGGLLYSDMNAYQSYLYSANFPTAEYTLSYESNPDFPGVSLRTFVVSKNQLFLFQSKSDGLGQYDLQISQISNSAFVGDSVTVSYSVEIKTPLVINQRTALKEFGSKFAYPLFDFSLSQVGLILGENNSWSYISILPQLELDKIEDYRPNNLIESGNKLYYYNIKFISGSAPIIQVKSTDNGPTWDSYQDVIIN